MSLWDVTSPFITFINNLPAYVFKGVRCDSKRRLLFFYNVSGSIRGFRGVPRGSSSGPIFFFFFISTEYSKVCTEIIS